MQAKYGQQCNRSVCITYFAHQMWNCRVIVSVMTFEGEDCRLAEVGRLADVTGGRVSHSDKILWTRHGQRNLIVMGNLFLFCLYYYQLYNMWMWSSVFSQKVLVLSVERSSPFFQGDCFLQISPNVAHQISLLSFLWCWFFGDSLLNSYIIDPDSVALLTKIGPGKKKETNKDLPLWVCGHQVGELWLSRVECHLFIQRETKVSSSIHKYRIHKTLHM